MKLYNLGKVGWKESQLAYHALAYEGIEGLVFSSPKERYISVGFPQNPKEELDLEYCKKENIGVFRRETGGGTVLLDHNQIFYNIIVHRNREDVPRSPDAFFRKYLAPVVSSLEDMGIKASYRPLCDIIVGNKKISGNGGGEIGMCRVLGGGLLLDFNRDTMARCLRASSDMRKRFKIMMDKNITTLRSELGYVPSRKELSDRMDTRFRELFGELESEELPQNVIEKMEVLDEMYFSDSWFYKRGIGGGGREIKVREGVIMLEKEYYVGARSATIRLETNNGRVRKIDLNGFVPPALRNNLMAISGAAYDRKKLLTLVDDIVAKHSR